MRVLLFIAYPAKKEGTTMKSMTTKLMVTAAAMLMAGLASAQTVTAQIPFAFRADGAVLPAGAYSLTTRAAANTRVFYVQNRRSLRSVIVIPEASLNATATPASAKLIFRCQGENCALTQIWTGGSTAYQLHVPRPSKNNEMVRIVTLQAERAE
jgi:hypothetical protein